MSDYYMILTDQGRALEAASLSGGAPVQLTEFATGDGALQVTASQTEMQNEVWRGSIGNLAQDPDNPSWLVAEAHIPPDVGGFAIREIGLFTADGVLFAVGRHPEIYKPPIGAGTALDVHLKAIIAVSNADAVTLLIDPSVILATREYVDQSVADAQDRTDGVLSDLDLYLSTALAGKAAASHTHTTAQVTGLDAALNKPGEVAFFAMSTTPAGWLKANGAAVSRITYAALFAVIGTTYGVGDGSTTFNLPDLRGEFIRCWDDGRGVDAGRAIGSTQKGTFTSIGAGPAPDSAGDYSVYPGAAAVTAFALDTAALADYPDTRISYPNSTVTVIAPNLTDASYGVVRPRNIALLACIKY